MVTVEDVKNMMTVLQEQNNENIRTLARQQMEALTQIVANSKPSGIMTDTRFIGKPITFKGEELKYPEWKAKLMAYLKMTVPDSENWIRWAAEEKSPITERGVTGELRAGQGVCRKVICHAAELHRR